MSADQALGDPTRRGHLQSSREGRFTNTPSVPSPSHNKQCFFASQGLRKPQRDSEDPSRSKGVCADWQEADPVDSTGTGPGETGAVGSGGQRSP